MCVYASEYRHTGAAACMWRSEDNNLSLLSTLFETWTLFCALGFKPGYLVGELLGSFLVFSSHLAIVTLGLQLSVTMMNSM